MNGMPNKKTIAAGIAVLVCSLLLAGCREDEQGRPIFHTKGVYEGKADHKLTKEQQDALRQRGSYQGL